MEGERVARNKYPEETVKRIVDTAMALFIEKGYEETSIQDIIDNLGGLTKGAIYHHFKSKEDIFDAVCKRMDEINSVFYDGILNDRSKNGYEKLIAMFESVFENPTNDVMVSISAKMLGDPRFLLSHVNEIYDSISPHFMQPVIEEGIKDGSIKTDYPKELSEMLLTLTNIWLNPIIRKCTPEQMERNSAFLV